MLKCSVLRGLPVALGCAVGLDLVRRAFDQRDGLLEIGDRAVEFA